VSVLPTALLWRTTEPPSTSAAKLDPTRSPPMLFALQKSVPMPVLIKRPELLPLESVAMSVIAPKLRTQWHGQRASVHRSRRRGADYTNSAGGRWPAVRTNRYRHRSTRHRRAIAHNADRQDLRDQAAWRCSAAPSRAYSRRGNAPRLCAPGRRAIRSRAGHDQAVLWRGRGCPVRRQRPCAAKRRVLSSGR